MKKNEGKLFMTRAVLNMLKLFVKPVGNLEKDRQNGDMEMEREIG